MINGLSRKELIHLNQQNQYRMTPYYYDFPGTIRSETEQVRWCVTDLEFPWCNAAFDTNSSPENIGLDIESFKREGATRNVPIFWFIGEDIQPPNLEEILEEHEFKPFGNSAAMALDLSKIDGSMIAPKVDESIVRVERSDSLVTWCETTAVGYGMPENGYKTLVRWFNGCRQLEIPMTFYTVFKGDIPVATSMLFLECDVAGIYFVATIPDYRRQGFAWLATMSALLDAKLAGYKIATLQASRDGEKVYQKIGFINCGWSKSFLKIP